MKDHLNIPIKTIYSALNRTIAGKSLREIIRFSPYKDLTESKEHWRRVLGPSAITYYHMLYLYKFISTYIKYELHKNPKKFSKEDIRTLLLAAITHDFGEAKITEKSFIGDISLIVKNSSHVEKEKVVFNQVLKSLEINESLKKEIKGSCELVVFTSNSNLSEFFRAIEHLEYTWTVLRVFMNHVYRRCFIRNGKLLIGNVLAVQTHINIRNAYLNPSIKYFLDKNASKITAAFRYCMDTYRKEKERKDLVTHDIDIAWKAWSKFISSL